MVACLVTGPFARAAPSVPIDVGAQQVEKLAAEAADAYRAGNYVRAVELLERAHRIRQIPALLYNLAKVYEKLGAEDKAIAEYRRYCDSADPDPKLRVKAEARILAYEEARRRPSGPGETEALGDTDDIDRGAGVRVVDEEEARRRASRRRRDRIGGVSLTALGVASALAGVGLSVNASRLHADFESRIGLEDEKRDLRGAARTQAIVGDVLYGVAALGVAVGIVLLWRGYHRERPRRSVALAAGGLSF